MSNKKKKDETDEKIVNGLRSLSRTAMGVAIAIGKGAEVLKKLADSYEEQFRDDK